MRAGGGKPVLFSPHSFCSSIYFFFLARFKRPYIFFPKYLESFLVASYSKSSLIKKKNKIHWLSSKNRATLYSLQMFNESKILSFLSSLCPLELLITNILRASSLESNIPYFFKKKLSFCIGDIAS